jgi:energy-coupling factor transporter ATP-binding protein EcfA2
LRTNVLCRKALPLLSCEKLLIRIVFLHQCRRNCGVKISGEIVYITRIQIEEGFLDGLDIQLASGLNVVIGARGTGKTSLIELIRFCLGSIANTPEVSRRSRDHALSVLGSGQITLTAMLDGQQIFISRSATDDAPRSSTPFPRPIIFSQTEIETVGLQAGGRLQLIDSFALNQDTSLVEAEAMAEFASVNIDVEKKRKELEDFDRQVASMAILEAELKNVAIAEATLSKTSEEIAQKTTQIEILSKHISSQGVLLAEGERINKGLAVWYEQIKSAMEAAPQSKTSISEQHFPYVNQGVITIQAKLQEALNAISSNYYSVKEFLEKNSAEKILREDATRVIRKDLEGLSEGAGQVLRKGQQLREQQAKILTIIELQKLEKAQLEEKLAKRNAILNKLDEIRKTRFNTRLSIVSELNRRLGPKIHIQITRNAQVHTFAAAIGDALKGSNLRYAEIAKSIADNLSPRALLEAVDSFDQDLISMVADITNERAARVLTHLRSTDLGKIGCIEIDDNVNFQLLDGKDFKEFASLSTGQRCTVVLPMVLAHQDNIIIVDQPEDHIDNAFITDTLIKAILARDKNTQILFTTHNPNIPVLGDADNVVHLASDGRRGFCLTAGNLIDSEVVRAISNVMEGGAEAFEKRSNFYSTIALL